MLKEVENNFVDFLSAEFLLKNKDASKRSIKSLHSKTKTRKNQNTQTDLLLSNLLLKEKYRKILAKMGKIESLLDKHLQKEQNKKEQDIEERLIMEWQKEFIKLQNDVLKNVPVVKRKKYINALRAHIMSAMTHPAHLFPFIFPKEKDLELHYVKEKSFVYHLTLVLLFVLLLSAGIVLNFSGFANKITRIGDKLAYSALNNIEHIFYTNRKDVGLDANPQFDKFKENFLSQKILSEYISKNSKNLQNKQGVLKLSRDDILGKVAGAFEQKNDTDEEVEIKVVKEKCISMFLKKIIKNFK